MEFIELVQKNLGQYTLFVFGNPVSDLANWFIGVSSYVFMIAFVTQILLFFVLTSVEYYSRRPQPKICQGLVISAFLPWIILGLILLPHHLIGFPDIHSNPYGLFVKQDYSNSFVLSFHIELAMLLMGLMLSLFYGFFEKQWRVFRTYKSLAAAAGGIWVFILLSLTSSYFLGWPQIH